MECPKPGPEPTLISRKEVEALYDILKAVSAALQQLGVQYIILAGSLLGAVRQHSILFCDDDVDIGIIDEGPYDKDTGYGSAYERVRTGLAQLLGPDFQYAVRPWEGGDKVRLKRMATVFLDIFTLRRYTTRQELHDLLARKTNGQPQSTNYVEGILTTIETAAFSQGEPPSSLPLFPCWQFNTRKAVEMWPKEVYREAELFPLLNDYKMGPLTGMHGPRMPALLLKRAFGRDCFDVYVSSGRHNNNTIKEKDSSGSSGSCNCNSGSCNCNSDSSSSSSSSSSSGLSLVRKEGGQWEGGKKIPLEEQHYRPIQPLARAARRATLHGKEQLMLYLTEQSAREEEYMKQQQTSQNSSGFTSSLAVQETTGGGS